jgi:O-antigen/teichoic acid export membrane protein
MTASPSLPETEEQILPTGNSTPAAPEMGRLHSTALRATVWTMMSYGASQVLRVISSLVLTRLLVPEYFGLMILVSTLIQGMSLLTDIGISPSIIQNRRGDDPAFLNTAWTLQVLRGVSLYLVALLLSWPLAHIYHQPVLLKVLPVLALNVLIGGFNSTNLLSMNRHMGVRRLFFIDFGTQLLALVVTISWAWIHPSIWALVSGSIISTLFRLITSHISRLIPGIRNTFRWEKESLHSLIHFGRWILLGTALYFFASQADNLIMGKLITLTLLGIYGVAYQISDIPRQVINSFCQKVGYPFISKMAHLPLPEFRQSFLRYRFYVLLCGAALLSFVVIWGGFITTHIYDHRYHEAGWMIPLLALGLWHTLLYATMNPALYAIGESRYMAAGNAFYCLFGIIGIPIAFHYFGMFGAVIVVAAGDFPLYVASEYGAVRKGVGTLWQDTQMTGAFLVMLAAELLLKRAFTGHFYIHT